MTSDELYDGVTRRSVLKTGAVTASAVTIGAAGAAAHHDDDHDDGGNGDNGGGNGGNGGGKQGGRAQVEGEPRTDVPFQLSGAPQGTTPLGASCMSAQSAQQTYLIYGIQYCDSDNDEDDTMYIHPEEAELLQDQVYQFRSVQVCKEPGDGYESDDIHKVSFGPSNQEC